MPHLHTPPDIPPPPLVTGSRQYKLGFADGWAHGFMQGYRDTLAIEITHMHPNKGEACEDGVLKAFDKRPGPKSYVNIPDSGSIISD